VEVGFGTRREDWAVSFLALIISDPCGTSLSAGYCPLAQFAARGRHFLALDDATQLDSDYSASAGLDSAIFCPPLPLWDLF